MPCSPSPLFGNDGRFGPAVMRGAIRVLGKLLADVRPSRVEVFRRCSFGGSSAQHRIVASAERPFPQRRQMSLVPGYAKSCPVLQTYVCDTDKLSGRSDEFAIPRSRPGDHCRATGHRAVAFGIPADRTRQGDYGQAMSAERSWAVQAVRVNKQREFPYLSEFGR